MVPLADQGKESPSATRFVERLYADCVGSRDASMVAAVLAITMTSFWSTRREPSVENTATLNRWSPPNGSGNEYVCPSPMALDLMSSQRFRCRTGYAFPLAHGPAGPRPHARHQREFEHRIKRHIRSGVYGATSLFRPRDCWVQSMDSAKMTAFAQLTSSDQHSWTPLSPTGMTLLHAEVSIGSAHRRIQDAGCQMGSDRHP